jgi:hypothetical protein
MAGVLQIKRGDTGVGSLNDGEFYLNKGINAVQIGSGSSILTLLPLNQTVTGDIILNGNIYANNLNISSSYALSSSYAQYAATASYIIASATSVSASHADTASYILSSNVYGPYAFNSIITASFAVTASYAPGYLQTSVTQSMLGVYLLTNSTASMLSPYVLSSQTSSFVTNNQTSSFVTTSTLNNYVPNSQTSSFVTNLQTSSFVTNNQTGSFILTNQTSSMLSPYLLNSQTTSFVTNTQTSSFVTNSQTASFILTSQTSSMTVGTASYVSSSNVYGPEGFNTILTASYSHTASLAYAIVGGASAVSSSYPFSVTGSTIYSFNSNRVGTTLYNVPTTENIIIGVSAAADGIVNNSIFLGKFAGYQITSSTNVIFIGENVGQSVYDITGSVFIGYNTGTSTKATFSNFIGYNAGNNANIASNSNFIGYNTGRGAISASYSTLIGYQAGYKIGSGIVGIGSNNIIIGTNITLDERRRDSINIGGILFGTGSHSDITGRPHSGSAAGRIGINVPKPIYNLHVSGTVAFSNLPQSSSAYIVMYDSASGQLYYTASSAISGSGGGGTTINTSSFATTGSNSFFGDQNISGRVSITGSLITNIGTGSFEIISLTSPLLYATSSYIRIGFPDAEYGIDMNTDGTGQTRIVNGNQITTWAPIVKFGLDDALMTFEISGSLSTTGSVSFIGLTSTPQSNILTYDSASGQLFYTASSAIGGRIENKYITTGSSSTTQTITGSLTITENLTVTGTASIQYLNVIYETASVIYSSGSNQFGDATNDIQTLIGTVRVSGSQVITGSLDVSNIQYASTSNLLAWNSTTGRVSYMNGGDVVVFPYTGSAVMSGSAAAGNTLNVIGRLAVSGSQQVTGSLGVTGSIYIGTRATNNIRYGGGYLNPGAAIIIEGVSGGPSSARILLHENSTDNSAGAAISFARSRAQDNLDAGWRIGGLDFYRAWGTIGGQTAFEQSAYIRVLSISGSSQTSVPSAMYFGTTPSGSITPQQRLVIQENGNVGIGALTASATLHVSGANMIFDIPSKQSGYVLGSDASGNATWVNPNTLTTTTPTYIANQNITASVSTATGSIFAIYSGSNTLLRVTDSGSLVLPSYTPNTTPTRYAFVSSGSTNTGLKFYDHYVWIFQSVGADSFKISNSAVEVTSGRINMNAQANQPYIQARSDDSANANNLTFVAGGLTKSGSIQLLNGNVLITQTHFVSGSNYKLQISGSGVSGSLNVNDVLLISSSNITLNIPSKANGYLLQSDTNGNATWINPAALSATIVSNRIATGSVTASLNVGTTTFQIVSGSTTFMAVTNNNRVGIGGITSPNYVLDVSSSLRVTGGTGQGQMIVDTNDAVNIGPGSGVVSPARLKIYGGTTQAGSIWFGHNETYAGEIGTNGAGRLIINPSTEVAFMIGGTEVAKVNNSGSLLLGTTTNRGYRLDVSSPSDSGSLRVSGSTVLSGTLGLDIAGKANGYLLQSDANGNATWVNPYNISLAPPTYIGTGSVTASVGTGAGIFNMFSITSGSSTGLTYSNEGKLTLTNVSGSSAFPTITTSNSFVITGGGVLRLGTNSNNSLLLNTNQLDRWLISGTGHLLSNSDGNYDIGASTSRVRNLYVAGTGSFEKGLIASSSVYLPQLPTTPQRYLLTYDSASGQVYYAATSSVITNTTFDSSSFATTGSNIFIGNQTVTGSLFTTGSNTLIGTTTLTGSLLVTGSTTQIGNNYLLGNTVLSGSIGISGSSVIQGTTTMSGSLLITGSTTQIGNNTLLGTTLLSGSIIISGALGTTTPTVQVWGDTKQHGYIQFEPVTTNIDQSVTASYIYVSGSTNDLYFTQNGLYANTTRLRWLESNLSTGLLKGGNMTSTPGSTTFTVASGEGMIVAMNASLANDPYPTIKVVSWPTQTLNIQYSGSAKITYVGIDSNGTVIQQTSAWGANDINQWDNQISLGVVLHLSGSVSTGVYNSPQISYGHAQQSDDFFRAFGPLKISGHTLQPSGSTLGLTKAAGTAYREGANYLINPSHPSTVVENSINTSKIYRYHLSGSTPVIDTGVANAGYTNIDPTKYVNPATGQLTTVTGQNSNQWRWTIQRVFWIPNSPTNAFIVYYGNAEYTTLVDAKNAIDTETFTEAPNTALNAILIGYILVRKGCTDLSDTTGTNALLIQAGLFRSVGGIGGSGTNFVSTQLSGLADVALSSLLKGDLLVYGANGGTEWNNTKQLSGSYGLTGSLFVIGQNSGIVSQDSYKTNDFFLVRNSTTTLKVNSGVEVSSSVAVPFKISNNTGDNILFVSQSGMVVFATSSVLPEGAAPHGAFLFTSGGLYIGTD